LLGYGACPLRGFQVPVPLRGFGKLSKPKQSARLFMTEIGGNGACPSLRFQDFK